MTEDSKISRRYRELAREEPPRHVDDAILAAARRAVKTRPAPLVVPSGRRRWYFPLAAAAIIVLAVAVTIHVEREQPDLEAVLQTQPAPETPPEKEARLAERPAAPEPTPQSHAPEARKPVPPKAGAKREFYAPDPKPAPAPEPAPPLTDLQKAPSPAAPPPPASVSEERKAATDQFALRRDEAVQSQAKPAPAPARARSQVQAVPAPGTKPAPPAQPQAEARAALGAAAGLMYASPEQWLQGIADLRRQGRHEEADKSLTEFRKRHPDYKIPEAMLEKLEKKN